MEDYISSENVDGFVVGLLLLAMKYGENIYIKGEISARLFYQIKHYVIPALNLANSEWKKIDVLPDALTDKIYSSESIAGTGISCGVDSFSTIYDHIDESEYHAINYLTFFNVGSHGDFNTQEASVTFKRRLETIKPYIEKSGKSLVTVDTNLSELLMMSHQQTHTIRAVSCILNLQKLFKYYYYAATHRFDFFEITDKDMAYYDILLLSMLSTESTTFYSAISQLTRVERTELITNYKPSYEFLNVCVSPKESGEGYNCSTCFKCLRTQLTLDVLGKLNLYEKVFDVNKYYQKKDKYIAQVLANKSENIYFRDIYTEMKRREFKISIKSRVFFMYYLLIRVFRVSKFVYRGNNS